MGVLMAAALLLASCSNASNSGSGNDNATETKTMVYKGTYTVAGTSYNNITIVQEKKTDGTYNRTYTMTGTGTSDNGIWARDTRTSSSVSKAVTTLKSGPYLLKSSTIKSASGVAAIWKFTTDASGNVEIDSVDASDQAYVLASGTGSFYSNASSESGGSDSGSGYSAADVIKAFGIDPTNASKTLTGQGNETHVYGVDTDYTAKWTMYIFGNELYQTGTTAYSSTPGYAVVISERDYTAGTHKGEHEVYGFKGLYYKSGSAYVFVHPYNLSQVQVPQAVEDIPLQNVLFGKAGSGKVSETNIGKQVYFSGNSITDVHPGN